MSLFIYIEYIHLVLNSTRNGIVEIRLKPYYVNGDMTIISIMDLFTMVLYQPI